MFVLSSILTKYDIIILRGQWDGLCMSWNTSGKRVPSGKLLIDCQKDHLQSSKIESGTKEMRRPWLVRSRFISTSTDSMDSYPKAEYP